VTLDSQSRLALVLAIPVANANDLKYSGSKEDLQALLGLNANIVCSTQLGEEFCTVQGPF
jgi:hypothetical protein